MLDRFRQFQNALLKTLKTKHLRYFYDELVNEEKLLAVVGARGVGKTTTLLQYLKNHKLPNSKKLYISVDWCDSESLFDIAQEFYKNGGKLLIIDEIHKYPNFEKELKNIYDIFDLRVIISGSSALSINHAKADLSRRVLKKEVKGLSFREFLEFKYGVSLSTITLDDLLKNHIDIAYDNLQKLDIPSITPDFKEYLQNGYYPFYFQNKDSASYLLKLKETINVVLEVDIPTITNIKYTTIRKFKKLIEFICTSSPYTPNMQTLLAKIDMHKNEYSELYMYLDYLEKAKILRLCRSANKKDAILTKPEKIYLNNTNLHFAYCSNTEIGTLREGFFGSMMEDFDLYIPKNGDFIINDKYTIEVGGKGKKYNQIKDILNSFVVADDIEIGSGNIIPLYLFGFLY
jgi:predicted AAA+ superfamily ATPase